jgi:hypothetical protein
MPLIDPEHPEQGTWEDTVPDREDGITPFVTRNRAVFATRLASTKAGGGEAIRISRMGIELHLEQLDALGQSIGSFVLRPLVDTTEKAKTKVTSVEITRTGSDSDGTSESLGPQDRAALAAIVDELSQFRGEQASSPGVIYFWRGLLEAIDAGIACGLAGVEGGLNPVADVGCSVAAGLMLDDDDDDDDPTEG